MKQRRKTRQATTPLAKVRRQVAKLREENAALRDEQHELKSELEAASARASFAERKAQQLNIAAVTFLRTAADKINESYFIGVDLIEMLARTRLSPSESDQ